MQETAEKRQHGIDDAAGLHEVLSAPLLTERPGSTISSVAEFDHRQEPAESAFPWAQPFSPVFPTEHDGLFNAVYGCAGNEAQMFQQARMEAVIALKAEEVAKEERREAVHQMLEEASMDPFEGIPPAMLNAFLYAREHKAAPMLLAGAMSIPFLGRLIGGLKKAHRASKGLEMLDSAPKQLPYYPEFAHGTMSSVRNFGPQEVLKEIAPRDIYTSKPMHITQETKERIAEQIVLSTSWLRGSRNTIPETRLAGPGFVRQGWFSGLNGYRYMDSGFVQRKWAEFRIAREIKKAKRDLSGPGAPKVNLPDGWKQALDESPKNFLFDRWGRMRWIDPVLIHTDDAVDTITSLFER